MKIKTVYFASTFYLGEYNGEKIGFTVELEDTDSIESVIEQLRQKTRECALPSSETCREYIYMAKKEIEELDERLEKARKEWDATAAFLRKQGIKPNAVKMPRFSLDLLPGANREEVVKGEIDSDDIAF